MDRGWVQVFFIIIIIFFYNLKKKKKNFIGPKPGGLWAYLKSILFYHPKGLNHSAGMVCSPLVHPHQRAKMRQAEIIFIPTPELVTWCWPLNSQSV